MQHFCWMKIASGIQITNQTAEIRHIKIYVLVFIYYIFQGYLTSLLRLGFFREPRFWYYYQRTWNLTQLITFELYNWGMDRRSGIA